MVLAAAVAAVLVVVVVVAVVAPLLHRGEQVTRLPLRTQ